MNSSKLNYPRTFILGFGFFGVSVIWGVYNAFVPLFLEQKFHLAPYWIGFFLTLDNIAALFVQPPIGSWSDRLRTRIGRRMPFILVGAPVGAIAFALIPIAGILPFFVACTSTLLLSMAIWRTPVVALMPDITPSRFRSQANGIINLMGGVGAIASYFGGAALYKLNPAYPFWMGAILVLGATALLFGFIREPKIGENGEPLVEKSEIQVPDAPIASPTTDFETKIVAPVENDGDFEPEEPQMGLWQSVIFLTQEKDKSALFLLLALFCWTIGYSAVEAFWTLYSTNHLGISAADATRLLGQLSLVFVLVALPSGYLAGFLGRRVTVGAGLVAMAAVLGAIYFLPVKTLLIPLFSLPILGVVPVVGILLMLAGVAWALVTIHALPMVVDMTHPSKIGTYTGLYYGFSTLAAIIGPNFNGLIIQLSGKNYNTIFFSSPLWMLAALILLLSVKRGEATN